MLYVSFPVGWRFVGAEAGVSGSKDRLVDAGGQCIEVQDIIKNCLRTKKRRAVSVDIKNEHTFGCLLTIYFRKHPPTAAFGERELLRYDPTQNGKKPSGKVELLSGEARRSSVESAALERLRLSVTSPLSPRDRAGSTVSGIGSACYSPRFSFTEVLSSERREELDKRAEEQRNNRRHTGDSPAAT